MAEIVGPRELLWRPVHHDSIDIAIQIPASTVRRLKDVAGAFGYGAPVLLCTILYNDACKPWEVRELEKRTPFGPLRWKPGRGNIYSVRVDLPGYQIVFLRMLSRSLARRDAVVSEALLALARQIQTAGALGGFPVPGDALEFAHKMVRSADLNAAR